MESIFQELSPRESSVHGEYLLELSERESSVHGEYFSGTKSEREREKSVHGEYISGTKVFTHSAWLHENTLHGHL